MLPVRTISSTILFMILFTVTCSQDSTPIQPHFFVSTDELFIYSLVIDSLLVIPGKEWVVFLDSTEIWPIQCQDTSRFPKLQSNTIENYQDQNLNGYPFRISLEKSVKTDYISWTKWELLGGWEGFYTSYPNSDGLLGFSRIGINDEGDQALLYMSWNINYLAGAGYLVILSKKGLWEIDRIEIVWIS